MGFSVFKNCTKYYAKVILCVEIKIAGNFPADDGPGSIDQPVNIKVSLTQLQDGTTYDSCKDYTSELY